MDCRWENFKNSPLQQLADLDLSFNQLSWDQKSFNDQVQRDPEPTTVFSGARSRDPGRRQRPPHRSFGGKTTSPAFDTGGIAKGKEAAALVFCRQPLR